MNHIINGNITQVQISGREAIEIGLFEASMLSFDGNSEESQVYLYFFGGIHGGSIWGREAPFSALGEFAQAADDVAGDIWSRLLIEIDIYLNGY